MPRTINLKKVISSELKETGYLGSDPQFDVEILFRRGASPEFSELVKVVIPAEVFFDVQRVVKSHINRHIIKADYLRGLIDEKASL
jgi:hypothetical protein